MVRQKCSGIRRSYLVVKVSSPLPMVEKTFCSTYQPSIAVNLNHSNRDFASNFVVLTVSKVLWAANVYLS
ncbi:Uncharacterised protein [Kluyvera cryocrescens]|uniref:Uncharacterized protein n=1 Tax=Kluyvera cryocrescens TaxID=580 RepID=A0A485BN34_KLUCR|nr:Uncharacterised protein [Kluyvera cryocrescens]